LPAKAVVIRYASMKRELKWLLWGFGLPLALMVGYDLMFRSSSLSIWQRITRPEDLCAYGSCVYIAGAIYVIVMIGRGVLTMAK
jgi:hypothetical protein